MTFSYHGKWFRVEFFLMSDFLAYRVASWLTIWLNQGAPEALFSTYRIAGYFQGVPIFIIFVVNQTKKRLASHLSHALPDTEAVHLSALQNPSKLH